VFWQCYAIKDEKTGFYHSPFFVKHVVEASRQFSVVINREGNMMHHYPQDHALYLLFHFDDESGIAKFTSSGVPELALRGQDVIQQPQEETSNGQRIRTP